MNDAPTTTKAWIKNLVVTQSIAIVGFVGVPILITLVASLTDIDFEHRENGIHARVTRYVLMYFPWKTDFVEDVSEVRASNTPAKYYRGTSEERRKGQKGVQLETGQVIIAHADTEVHIDVDPKLAKEIEASFKRFQLDKSAAPIHFRLTHRGGSRTC